MGLGATDPRAPTENESRHHWTRRRNEPRLGGAGGEGERKGGATLRGPPSLALPPLARLPRVVSPMRRIRSVSLSLSGLSPGPQAAGGPSPPARARSLARSLAARQPSDPSPPAAAGMLWLLVALGLVAAYFSLLDGWYLVRVPLAVLRARLLQPPVRDLLAEQSYAGRVLPSDLDLLRHMNNARYLREADVARAAHLARCGVLGALRALGAHAVLAASCARYRRSLRLLEPFEVRTRLLGWDGRAFYLESRFISGRDGFVCALLLFRQHVLGTTPDQVVQYLCKRRVESPELPEDLQHWINYNEASSQKLRAEFGLSSTKDQ
ncbi:LOW QUALITY PROTEIN: protein THEM6 [Dromiciops gliroides]|uniref:LOW QUALITY PROTEIN: protein THEM6 n=1 Tax=Dromiciops gliroides TaxID=33562 RepID=UPI001CC4B39F|nr:LOW QUALITY PROTEIN: protein THEM6 [Dromiciops gliroides]